MKTLHSSPGLEDLWQMHFSLLSGQEYTVPGMFIANTVDDQPTAVPVAPAAAPAPGLEDLWQMHFSLLSGQEYTVPGMFIANTVDDQPTAVPVAPAAAPAPG